MRLSIRHDIVLAYQPAAKSALGVLRLQPRLCDNQQIQFWNIELDHDCGLNARDDAYGNACRVFHAEGPLEKLTIAASGEITTFDTAGVLRGAPEPFPPELFLRETELTTPDAALAAFAQEVAGAADTALDKPHRLMRALHEMWTPARGNGQTGAKAFAARAGDARDMSHAMIAAARALGLPARMVSGYLAVAAEALTAAHRRQDLHAWAEIFVEGYGWIGFDPTLCLCATDAHVHLATGPDYADVDPLRAAFYGGGAVARVSRLTIADSEGAVLVAPTAEGDALAQTQEQG